MNENLMSAYASFTTADEYGAAAASPAEIMLPTTTVLWTHGPVAVTFVTHC